MLRALVNVLYAADETHLGSVAVRQRTPRPGLGNIARLSTTFNASLGA